MALVEVKVPDIGDFKEVAIIEVLVKPGDAIKAEQSLITVESDKASMEIPSSHAGVVKEVKVAIGDKVNQARWCCCWKWPALLRPTRLLHLLPLPQPLWPPRLRRPQRPPPRQLPQPPARSRCWCPTSATSRTWPSSSCWSRSATR